jgi:predicted permease
MNLPVLLFTSLTTIAAAGASGLLPAWHLSRTDAAGQLAETRRGAVGSAGGVRSGRWVVAAQLALSLPLLVGAGLLVQTILNLQRPDLGFRSDGLLLARLDLGRLPQDPLRRDRALRAVMNRLSETAGVERVSFSQLGVLGEGRSTAPIEVEGGVAAPDANRDTALDRVGADYFTTLGIPLLAGRDVEPRDGADAAKVAIVNAAFAARFFGRASALGRHVTTIDPSGDRTVYTVVGVAADAHAHGLRRAVEPRFFVPAEQRASGSGTRTLLVRTRMDAPALQAALAGTVAAIDRELAVTEVISTRGHIARLTAEERALAQLATLFGVVAVILAALGLYGVLAFGVARRTQEIAVRMALGAESRGVVRMILSENFLLLAAATGAGSVLATLGARVLRSQLYGITAEDPATLAGAAGVLLLVATIAVYLPARRASRIEPMAALRRV